MGKPKVTAVFASIVGGSGMPLVEVLWALERAFRGSGAMPRNFRSALEPPSRAGNMRTGAPKIDLPEGLPYIAGVYCMGGVRLTGAAIAPGTNWYGEFHDAKLVMKGASLPLTLATGVRGMRLADVVDTPLLRSCPDVITQRADLTMGNVTLCTDNAMIEVEEDLPWRHDRPLRAA
jgi:hypothetical protein